MECHCKDHLPGEWHSNKPCDCHEHDHPTFSFVITKVMEDDPGSGTVYVSKTFMENLDLEEGDAVEIVGESGLVVQARSHPNPWIDTRMVSLDRQTMNKAGFQLFGQMKLRKAPCREAQTLCLEVPKGSSLTRRELHGMLEQAAGSVLSPGDLLALKNRRGSEIAFKVLNCEPDGTCRLAKCTRVQLLDHEGEEFVSRHDTTFEDVGGLDDAVAKVREVVSLPLQHPEIFYQLGIDPPRGVLLHGPSGTGKTLIARAVAGATGCWFKSIMGTEIMDKHYGESEAKLRAAFEEAYQNAPAILFIDEIDALAPRRDTAEQEVDRRVTAQLLALMDGMEDRGQVVVLAATNLPNTLDSALRRPGRFDREILVGVPDKAGRKEILLIHTRGMPMGAVDLDELAEKTHGFVGADIKALCQEAGFKALRRILPGLERTEQKLSADFVEALHVDMQDFEAAILEMKPSAGRTFEVDLRGYGWERIAGYEQAKEFVREVILWPLHNVTYLAGLGVGHPEGLVVTGPSGVGKTLFARSLARESGFNVIEIRGPELISKYMGESERNVRELFRQARQMAPTVVILDGVGAMTSSGWSDAKVIDRVVNQLVMEMNEITGEKPVLVVAVTERADDLPPALRATGRFSHELPLGLPDAVDRALLFKMFLDKERVSFTGDFESVARQAEDLSGGDIAAVCRRIILQAARCALERNRGAACEVTITEDDLLKMLDKWKLTTARRHER